MARVGREGRERARALAATQAALEQEQRLAALGTLAAAAAHELGTPLGTILLAAKELADSWEGDEHTQADLNLIVEQTTRCRNILAELRQKRTAGDSNHFTYMNPEALLREAGAPHEQRGISVRYQSTGENTVNIRRTPELIHAFRNIIENAVGFARDAVNISVIWSSDALNIVIRDDGPGFDPQIIKRLGEPYVTTRQPTPGKDGGLGLGLFIAKTLLVRSGADVQFEQNSPSGALINIHWDRSRLVTDPVTSVMTET
jgi:two-component system sensor histidine kinase RegB